ncbi:MAG: hypothetical protein B7Y77_02330, partial [Bradyrhizobium sp. 35-63-5]
MQPSHLGRGRVGQARRRRHRAGIGAVIVHLGIVNHKLKLDAIAGRAPPQHQRADLGGGAGANCTGGQLGTVSPHQSGGKGHALLRLDQSEIRSIQHTECIAGTARDLDRPELLAVAHANADIGLTLTPGEWPVEGQHIAGAADDCRRRAPLLRQVRLQADRVAIGQHPAVPLSGEGRQDAAAGVLLPQEVREARHLCP